MRAKTVSACSLVNSQYPVENLDQDALNKDAPNGWVNKSTNTITRMPSISWKSTTLMSGQESWVPRQNSGPGWIQSNSRTRSSCSSNPRLFPLLFCVSFLLTANLSIIKISQFRLWQGWGAACVQDVEKGNEYRSALTVRTSQTSDRIITFLQPSRV